MSPLVHLANVIFLLSYLVRDILWLRLLAAIAQICLLVAALTMWNPSLVAWNALFCVINVVRIYLLVLERRPVKLDAREARLYELVFRTLTARELKALLARGRWQEVPAGDIVIERGKHPARVMVLEDGIVDVMQGGEKVCELGAGSFVGEMSFLTGEPPRADVKTQNACRFFAWEKEALTKMLRDSPELRAQVQTAIGHDLVAKLRST